MRTHGGAPRRLEQSSQGAAAQEGSSSGRAGRRSRWWRWGVLALAGLTLAGLPERAAADCNVSPGTVITKANWQQYKDCFSDGEQYLWTGTEFWKMPDDIEIHVGPQHQWTLPKPYVEATEKYGGQTQLVKQSDGTMKLGNYIAGTPFPNPSGPAKGTEIMANVTYKMGGYMSAVFLNLKNQGAFYTKDRFGNYSAEIVDALYRQLAYNWQSDQGIPQIDPQAAGTYFSEWIMVEQPEQSRYTSVLTLIYQDNLRDDDDYAFVPALRRTLRLSSSARCAPLLGSDMVKDDQRVGWNGGVGKFEGQWLRDQKLLTLEEMNSKAAGKFPAEYDGMLGWPKPSWGTWETRDAYVVDVRRVPSLAAGYCYGKRIDYVDKEYYSNLAEDVYDSNMKLWKVVTVSQTPAKFDNYGEQPGFCGIVETYWDVQNDHASYITSFNPQGACSLIDGQVPKQYNNVSKYSTPGGLMQNMR
jgi:hypothetical protein